MTATADSFVTNPNDDTSDKGISVCIDKGFNSGSELLNRRSPELPKLNLGMNWAVGQAADAADQRAEQLLSPPPR